MSKLAKNLVESPVTEFYKGKTIFLTGSTGFLGKVFIEKICRVCPDIQKMYVILRPKKGKTTKQRLDDMVDSPMFENLKKTNPNFIEKLSMIEGDCALPNLGISFTDQEKLVKEVDVVVHCAATTRFDEHLRTATYINVRALHDLIQIAEKMEKLKAFIHVSTAYSNCIRKDVGEICYKPTMSPGDLINIVDGMDNESLTAVTPILLKDHPNTYTFTKQVAEQCVEANKSKLPIAIFRPSIVISSYKEPMPGWIDNMFGPVSASVGVGVGVVRCLPAKRDNNLDIVPVDYVINSIISFVWDVATKYEDDKINKNLGRELPICNFVSSVESPLTQGDYISLAFKHFSKYPTLFSIWYATVIVCTTMTAYKFWAFFFHTIPAHLFDLILTCIGRKPMVVKGYTKIDKFMTTYAYFAYRQWNFKNDNVQRLWRNLTEKDKDTFPFSMKNFDWSTYFDRLGLGGRIYLLKDPIETLDRAKKWFLFLKFMHYAVITLFLYGFYKLCMSALSYLFVV